MAFVLKCHRDPQPTKIPPSSHHQCISAYSFRLETLVSTESTENFSDLWKKKNPVNIQFPSLLCKPRAKLQNKPPSMKKAGILIPLKKITFLLFPKYTGSVRGYSNYLPGIISQDTAGTELQGFPKRRVKLLCCSRRKRSGSKNPTAAINSFTIYFPGISFSSIIKLMFK